MPAPTTTFALDSDIDALCGGPVASPIDWTSAYMLTGCTREAYFAGLANMLLVAGIRLVSGYRATARSARSARHLAYSSGAVKPPRRETAADRHRAEMALWWD